MKNPPPCLSELPFAALLAYSPRGKSPTSIESRKVRDAVKNDRGWRNQEKLFIQLAAEKLLGEVEAGGFAGLFGPDVGLVAAPRSAPLTAGALWPGRRICQELERLRLGSGVLDCVERVEPVRKAAFASSAGAPRPTIAEHLATLECTPNLLAPRRLLLIDDFVTSGTMLIATATVLRVAYPQAEVNAFALVRTMSAGDVERILDPCSGRILFEGGAYARRDP